MTETELELIFTFRVPEYVVSLHMISIFDQYFVNRLWLLLVF